MSKTQRKLLLFRRRQFCRPQNPSQERFKTLDKTQSLNPSLLTRHREPSLGGLCWLQLYSSADSHNLPSDSKVSGGRRQHSQLYGLGFGVLEMRVTDYDYSIDVLIIMNDRRMASMMASDIMLLYLSHSTALTDYSYTEASNHHAECC